MIIEVIIDDNILEEPVKKAVAVAVNQVVREVVNDKVNSLKSGIEDAVNTYITKNFTDEKLKKLINNDVIQQLVDRLKKLD